MSRLPIVSSRDMVKVLHRIEFHVDHQTGSHVILKRMDPPGVVTVPMRKEIPKGTLKSIIKQTGLTTDQFLDLL